MKTWNRRFETLVMVVFAAAASNASAVDLPGTRYSYDNNGNLVGTTITPAPATGVTLTPSLPGPQMPGTAVIFTAEGQGSTGYQYRFWLYDYALAAWSVPQDWSTTAIWTLAGTTPAGLYRVVADVRTDPLSTGRDAFAFINYDLVAQAPATGVTLTPSAPNPQAAGTYVIFTAAGEGSTGYEYRFWLYDYNTATWTVEQDWSATEIWALLGTTPPGLYRVVADVKTNHTTIRDAFTYIDYTLTP